LRVEEHNEIAFVDIGRLKNALGAEHLLIEAANEEDLLALMFLAVKRSCVARVLFSLADKLLDSEG